ncbi:acylphosphatase [Fusibacter ferrireducens]|uniref:acylphosphatase n=1 Tax=Fusibacter ferrireducens TaxID=2785058 RepID=A0ABR9ZN56_9FIRM|nr:acylphosphatase [Fusibacter ferrireducens]MBF4691892.1 acylphosphatase [Fusibacter ferrireducens]
MIRIHAIIHGRVQAVGFRYFAYHLAKQYELTGWVKNLYDGTVEMEIQGDSKTIETFLTALRKGNGFSSISAIDVDQIQLLERERKFVIL